jgi:hypothetical protein
VLLGVIEIALVVVEGRLAVVVRCGLVLGGGFVVLLAGGVFGRSI